LKNLVFLWKIIQTRWLLRPDPIQPAIRTHHYCSRYYWKISYKKSCRIFHCKENDLVQFKKAQIQVMTWGRLGRTGILWYQSHTPYHCTICAQAKISSALLILTSLIYHTTSVPLPLSTGQHVLGSSERKNCRLFFLEEVPPPLSTGLQLLRTHLSKKPDSLENTPSHCRWNQLLWAELWVVKLKHRLWAVVSNSSNWLLRAVNDNRWSAPTPVAFQPHILHLVGAKTS